MENAGKAAEPTTGPEFNWGPWAIARRELFPIHRCWISSEDWNTPWVIAIGGRVIGRSVVQSGRYQTSSIREVLEWVDRLNADLPQLDGDDTGLGLIQTIHPRISGCVECGVSAAEFGEFPKVLGRGVFDAGVGLGPGGALLRVGAWICHSRAPKLASYLNAHFCTTEKPQPLYTRAQRRDMLAAEQRAAAVAAQHATEQEALGKLAVAVFGKDTDALRERARAMYEGLDRYRAALSTR
jgi:hypothetical protein